MTSTPSTDQAKIDALANSLSGFASETAKDVKVSIIIPNRNTQNDNVR